MVHLLSLSILFTIITCSCRLTYVCVLWLMLFFLYYKGSDSIEIIHLDSPLIEDEEEIEWDGNAFEKMENLRTLIIKKCHFSEAPKYLPHSLRVLEWWRYPSESLPYDFNPNQLVIHKLPKGIKFLRIIHKVFL